MKYVYIYICKWDLRVAVKIYCASPHARAALHATDTAALAMKGTLPLTTSGFSEILKAWYVVNMTLVRKSAGLLGAERPKPTIGEDDPTLLLVAVLTARRNRTQTA